MKSVIVGIGFRTKFNSYRSIQETTDGSQAATDKLVEDLTSRGNKVISIISK